MCVSLFLLPISVLSDSYAESPAAPTAERLLAIATEKKLYKHQYWRILLHYKNTLTGNTKSLIDDPAFFISEQGKVDPQAEMEAVITTFFQETAPTQDLMCRYIARYTWLREQLLEDEPDLPAFQCDELASIRPTASTLIFPAYYVNNPASMFGHTLLNIETGFESSLLSKAINYSANATDSNGFLFAFKGIFGLYQGFYSSMPYYEKIQEYNNLDQRDMWEYTLNLTKDELNRMVRHIRELENIYSYYYFFGENCSYNILFLLEAARPSARLTERFGLWALPIDTIKAAFEEGFIQDVRYRPSKMTTLQHQLDRLSSEHQDLAFDMAHGTITPQSLDHLTVPEHIVILDVSIHYLQYRLARHQVTLDEYKQVFFNVLKTRSTFPKPEGADGTPPLPAHRPDTVHKSERLSLGIGRDDGNLFQYIGYRPVLTDLTDLDYPDEKGFQIQFTTFEFRGDASRQNLALERLALIDIISLAPRHKYFKTTSWKVNTGFVRKRMWDHDRELVYTLNSGFGRTLYHDITGLNYLLTDVEFQVGGALKDSYALGAGLSGGIVKRLFPWWKMHLDARSLYFGIQHPHLATTITWRHTLKLSEHAVLSLEAAYEDAFGQSRRQTKAGLNIYF